ncbi:MAG: GspE/PulE family protein [Granulosicoccus sp.]
MLASPSGQSPRRAIKTFTRQETHQAIGSMLLRDGCLSQAILDKAMRLLNKLDEDTTLFSVLRKLVKIEEAQLLQCIRQYQPGIPLGALLVELDLLTQMQLKQALRLQEQNEYKEKLGELLLARRMIKERDLTRVLAAQHGYSSLDLDISKCEQPLLDKVTVKLARAMRFIPVSMQDDDATVAFIDPMSQESRTEAARALECTIVPVMVSPRALEAALAALERRRQPRGANDSRIAAEDSASGRVNRILQEAIRLGASDIHIEPLRTRVRVRLRVDGMLREQNEFHSSELDAVVSRLKIMAEGDIVERRRHQDGRIEFEDPENGSISDLRVSFYVTVNGEAVVLRVLNQNNKVLDLDSIGMAQPLLDRFRRQALDAPSGVIIVTGPTGSGKTSTLYSCVRHLNNDSTSIITAEDPVEFQVDGISQCSVSAKLGRTFDESLRHMVRQDPDIIVLGEIRDSSSADSAIQAALTGHKVLTTFHTEDSVGCLLRLMNMDIEAFLISSTVVCVIAQRLLRRVCRQCARPGQPDFAGLQQLGCSAESFASAKFEEGEGCEACQFTGYKGRVGVFESLVLSEQVREAIVERKTATQIRNISIETAGLVTLLEDGIVKAARGETTISEIRRSLPRLTKPRDLQELRRLTGKNL